MGVQKIMKKHALAGPCLHFDENVLQRPFLDEKFEGKLAPGIFRKIRFGAPRAPDLWKYWDYIASVPKVLENTWDYIASVPKVLENTWD